MKQFLLTSLVVMAGLMKVHAAPVDPETAASLARNFYYEQYNIQGSIDYDQITTSDIIIVDRSGTILYYVINIGVDKGWVAVTADDRCVPVFSYAFEGTYGNTPFPPGFQYWLGVYEQQIAWAIENNVARSQEAVDLWSHYLKNDPPKAKSTLAVSPLLGSIAWGQGCYYNGQCPIQSGGQCGRVPTGCVATAMAMIMKYHAYPLHGFNSHTYTHSTYGTLSANFGSATYGWSSMPNTASTTNTELAEIMKHCGVAVDMNYGLYGSGAYMSDAKDALKEYFVYAATYAYKGMYTDTDWKAMLKTDLDQSRPILYAGTDISGGHAFVCDGYQGASNDYFHFNWGWDGAYNSYNYIDDLVPGHNSSNGDFTSNQEIIYSIYPNPATTPAANFSANSTSIQANNFINFTDQSSNEPLIWSWSVSPSTGTQFVGSTSSASQNPKIYFTIPGQYSISLTATNSAGTDTETKTNYITVSSGAGIEEEPLSRILIYPNPCVSYTILQDPSGADISELQCTLMNLCGESIPIPGIRGDQGLYIDLQGIPAGIYYLMLNNGEERGVKKIVITP